MLNVGVMWLNGWVDGLVRFLWETVAITYVEFKKLLRDPTEVLSRAVQPVLWLGIFGEVFSHIHAIPTGKLTYLAFLTPGILAQSILFSAIFYGVAVIWERDLGIIHKILVSPAHRTALVMGKALSSSFRGLVQAVIIYVLAYFLGIQMNFNFLAIIGILAAVILGSAIFSTFSLIIACVVKTRERFMGIGQLMTMPLFFASNAIYPIAMMPRWLRLISEINPLTYLVDILRRLMIVGGENTYSLNIDFGVLLVVFVILLLMAAKIYPRLIQ